VAGYLKLEAAWSSVYPATSLHGVTTRKTTTSTFIAVKTSSLAWEQKMFDKLQSWILLCVSCIMSRRLINVSTVIQVLWTSVDQFQSMMLHSTALCESLVLQCTSRASVDCCGRIADIHWSMIESEITSLPNNWQFHVRVIQHLNEASLCLTLKLSKALHKILETVVCT